MENGGQTLGLSGWEQTRPVVPGSALCLRSLLLKYFLCLIFFPFEILSQVFSF